MLWSMKFLRHHDEGYGCPIATANLGNLADALFLQSAPAQLLVIAAIMPTAGPHLRLSFMVSPLPSCLAALLSHLCLHARCSCRNHDRYREAPWHKHELPWSNRCMHTGSAGMLDKGFCLLVLCCPCAYCLGVKSDWRRNSVDGGGRHVLWLLLPWPVMPDLNTRSFIRI